MTMRVQPRQQRFIEEYMVDLNGTAAARRAGYKGNFDVEASRLLAKPHIKAAVDALKAEERSRLELKADDLKREAWAMAQDPKQPGQVRMEAIKYLSRLFPELADRPMVDSRQVTVNLFETLPREKLLELVSGND